MKTVVPFYFKMLYVSFFIFYFSTSVAQPFCDEICQTNFSCGSLAVSGGLCPGSPSSFCEGDTICVENNSITASFDWWLVWWADGSCDSFPNTTTVAYHVYNIVEDTCLVDITGLNWPITIKNIKNCDLGHSLNCVTTWIKIKVNPVASFDEPQAICKDQEACFLNTTCLNADSASFKWYIDNNLVSQDSSLCYTFPTSGFYDVCLVATNECGSDTVCHSVYVIEIPIAHSIFSFATDSCLPSVVLLMDQSVDAFQVEWKVIEGDDYEFIVSNVTGLPDTTLILQGVDTFTIMHIAINPCGADTSFLVIPIYDVPDVSIVPPLATCDSIYIPEVTYSGSIDTAKWIVVNTTDSIYGLAPQFTLDVGTHTIVCEVTGPCGTAADSVTITVNGSANISFIPIEALCVNSNPVPLEVVSDVTGDPVPLSSGTLSGDTAFIQSGFFNPDLIGIFYFCFETANGLCPDSTCTTIEVIEGVEVDVGSPEEICINIDSFQITFSPNGGVWTGPGIIDSINGIFDPEAAGGGNHILAYEYEDVAGCVSYKTKEITVIGLPSISANNTSICQTDLSTDIADLANFTFPSSDPNLSCFIDGAPDCIFTPDQLDTGSYEIIFRYTVISGCSISDTVSLDITELVQVTAPADTTVCSAQMLMLNGTPSSCAIWLPNPFISTGGEVYTDQFIGSQTFTIGCNFNTVCSTTDDVTVTVVNGSEVNLLEDWICQTQFTYTLPEGIPSDGTWFGDELNGNVVNVSLLDVGSYVYEYTVSYLPDICETSTFILHVEPSPVAAFTNPVIGCVGVGIQFNNMSMGASQYFWDFGNDSTSTDYNPVLIFDEPGLYTITLEARTVHPFSNDVLCIETATDEIYILESPQNVAIEASSLMGCGPLPVTFNISLNDDENMNYQWCIINKDTIDGPDPDTIIFEQIGTDTTFYDIILKGWNDCDTLYDFVQVAVLPIPHAEIGLQFDEPCSGGEMILNNLSLGNPENNIWIITNITLPTQPDTFTNFNPPSVTVFAPDSAEATVVVQLITSNECGSDMATDTIIVAPSPIVAKMSYEDEQVCVGDLFQAVDISTPGTDPKWDVIQSDQTAFTFFGDTLNFIPTVPGLFTVIVYAYGCGFDSDTVVFEAMPLPEIEVAYDPEVSCEGEPVHFEVTSAGNGLILYYGDMEFTNLHISDHLYTEGNTYSILAIVESPFGCQSEWTGSITIEDGPSDLAVSFTDSICVGTLVEFEGQGTNVQSWEWTFCEACNRTGQMVSYTFDTSGIFNVALVGATDLGCRDTVETPFYVRVSPQAIIDVEIITNCTPAELILHNLSLNETGVDWETSSGQLSLGDDPAVMVDEPGQLDIQLIATNGAICYDTASVTVPIVETPTFTVIQTPNCTNEQGAMVSVETEETNFVTLFGADYEEEGNYYQQVPPGVYLVEVMSNNGCVAEEELIVTPTQELFIQLEQNHFSIDMGEEAQLKVISNLSGVSYVWSPTADLNNPSIPNPIARPFVSTFYAVAVTDGKGCVKYDTAYVEVNINREDNIFIPNTFTPNNDGPNDIFRIRSLNPGLANINSFEIFDRFGEKVYEAYDCEPETATCGWDGSFRYQKAEMGLYIWMAELEFVDGVTLRRRGGVTLLR